MTSTVRRMSDVLPDLPFGYCDPHVIVKTNERRMIARCFHVNGSWDEDVMYCEWNPDTREWNDWQIEF